MDFNKILQCTKTMQIAINSINFSIKQINRCAHREDRDRTAVYAGFCCEYVAILIEEIDNFAEEISRFGEKNAIFHDAEGRN